MGDVAMSRTSRHDPLVAALARHLCWLDVCSIPTCPDHLAVAGSVLKFLANEGALLPVGVSVQGVEQDGQRGWRVRADGLDVTGGWRPA